MPVSSLHIIRNATMYIKHSTVLHLATDLNLKFVYFIYSFYLLTVQCVIENTATKKTHEKVPKKYQKSIKISVIENPIIHLSTYHKNTIPMSNLSVNDIGSGHLFFFSFTIVRWYDQVIKS